MKLGQGEHIASKAIDQLSQALKGGHNEPLRNYLAAIGDSIGIVCEG